LQTESELVTGFTEHLLIARTSNCSAILCSSLQHAITAYGTTERLNAVCVADISKLSAVWQTQFETSILDIVNIPEIILKTGLMQLIVNETKESFGISESSGHMGVCHRTDKSVRECR
jgi:hypothetical protein